MNSARNTRVPFWKQPLLHFAIIGALIFAWDNMRVKSPSSEGNKIVVTAPQVERMVVLWGKTWGRPPTDRELQGLVRDHIKEEIYYREARKLGLDQNDVVIRRRLRQKMEFLSLDSYETKTPDDALLRAFYLENQDRYFANASYDLQQIYYKPDDAVLAERDLSKVKAGASPSTLGHTISLPKRLENTDEAQVARLFGSSFYDKIQSLPDGEWAGPIKSGFGLHLVNLKTLTPTTLLKFESVKDKVVLDWQAEAKLAAQEDAFQKLVDNYTIDIQIPAE